eukprot:gnl/MRDRNA2_/MRDRNA2_86563_c0_seq2.p1 gnl/MRDRNA2_/MRDRNA2_86563_c0~~gnl/MRDRNA2_/MRDRNA2_86563_c0_seq2.p1  ORF type:complete len:1137 (-),score=254.68 gnl/MRDRNA2_/MRDRNA2_86563_c0_seq2:173-3583(-)
MRKAASAIIASNRLAKNNGNSNVSPDNKTLPAIHHNDKPKTHDNLLDMRMTKKKSRTFQSDLSPSNDLMVDGEFLQGIQSDLTDRIEKLRKDNNASIGNFQSEVKQNMAQLVENFVQVTGEMQKKALAESRQEISKIHVNLERLKSERTEGQQSAKSEPSTSYRISASQLNAMHDDLRSLFQDTATQILSGVRSEIYQLQTIRRMEFTPIVNKIDVLEQRVDSKVDSSTKSLTERVDRLHSKVDSSIKSLMDQVDQVPGSLAPRLNKIDEVQESVLSGVLKMSEVDLSPVLQALEGLEAVQDSVLKTVLQSSGEQKDQNSKVQIQLEAVLQRSREQTNDNSKVQEQNVDAHLYANDGVEKILQQIKTQQEEQMEAFDSKIDKHLDPIVQKLGILGPKLETTQENLLAQANSTHQSLQQQIEMKLPNKDFILQAVENVKVREQDFLPVMNKIDALSLDSLGGQLDASPAPQQVAPLKLDASCLDPVVEKMEAIQASIMKQKDAEVKNILEQVAKIGDLLDPLQAAMIFQTNTDVKTVLEHMLKVADILDPSHPGMIQQTNAEIKSVLEQVMKIGDLLDPGLRCPDPDVMNRIDSLDASVQQSIKALSTDKDWLSPILSKLETLCGTISATMDKELVQIRESVQNARVGEKEFDPSLSQNLSQIDVLEKNTSELHRVVEAMEKLKVHEEDLLPVTRRIDILDSKLEQQIATLKSDVSFLNPVNEKIGELQAATLKQIGSEFETLLDSVQKVPGPIIERIDSLDSGLQNQISGLKTDQGLSSLSNKIDEQYRLMCASVDKSLARVMENVQHQKVCDKDVILPTPGSEMSTQTIEMAPFNLEMSTQTTERGFLPAGWEETSDPMTGKVCYINKAGRMKCDEPPVPAPSAEVMVTWDVLEDPEADKGPLPAGWQVRKDPVTGEIMYYHPETGTLTSSRPEMALLRTEKGFLAAGWEETFDPEAGKVCYTNGAIGMKSDQPVIQAPGAETMATWEVLEDPGANAVMLAVGWELRKDPVTGAGMYYHPEMGILTSSLPEKWEPPVLIQKWEEIVAPSTGNVYYIQKETGMSFNESRVARQLQKLNNDFDKHHDELLHSEFSLQESNTALEIEVEDDEDLDPDERLTRQLQKLNRVTPKKRFWR